MTSGVIVHESWDADVWERDVELLLSVGRVDDAVAAVSASWPTMTDVDGSTLRRVIDRIPEHAWAEDPWIMAAMGSSYRSVGSPSRSAALPWFRTAEALIAVNPPSPAEIARIRIRSSAALRSLGQMASATAAAQSAMDLLDQDLSLSASVRVSSQAEAALHWGLSRLHEGDIDDARRSLRFALGLGERGLAVRGLVECLSGLAMTQVLAGDYPAATGYVTAAKEAALGTDLLRTAFGAGALVAETLVALEQNRLDDAYAIAPSLAAAAHRSDWEPFAELAAASVSFVDGRHIEGLDHVRRCLVSAKDWDSRPLVVSMAELTRGGFLMQLGEYAASVAVFESILPSPDHGLCPARYLAGVRYKAGDSAGCLRALAACEALGEAHSALTVIDVLLLSAAANYDLDNQASADVAVDRALHLAAANGAVLSFVVVSTTTMQRMLGRASDRYQPAQVTALLDRMRDGSAVAAISGSLEPLSDRELDVAQQLSEDRTVSQIATELFISTNTVKTHVRSIYRKLAANNRRDAVRRVRELGLRVDITPL